MKQIIIYIIYPQPFQLSPGFIVYFYYIRLHSSCLSAATAAFSSRFLLFLAHLKDIKLQIIRIPSSPQYGMIRRLGPEFHLAQTLMGVSCRLADGLGKQLIIHEMGAGTGCQKSLSFTSFMARRLISRYPRTAFLIEFLDLVNAGGSRITTSYFSPFFSSSGRSSKTSSQINFTRSSSPLSFAFSSA